MHEYLRSHPCVDCGETDILALQFDHREPATKRTEVALLVVRKPWSIVISEIAKCDVRCANCHRRRTAAQLGWHRGPSKGSGSASAIIGAIVIAGAETRRCGGCGEIKPVEEFPFRDRARGRRRTRCKACMREYARAHYRRNKDRYAKGDWSRKRCARREVNREIADYLRSHPCVDCGETDPVVLDFDHRDGVEKVETIAFLRARGRREDLFVEIEKCDVRCANCHQRRTAKQFAWKKLLFGEEVE
jgi:hypothetical protein